MNNPYKKYKQTQVTSASREEILLMMYEGAIKFNKLALKAAQENKVYDRCINLSKAFDIVNELNNTLDHEVGGDLAKQLEQLYIFVTDQYTKANLTGEAAPLEGALKVLENLYEGWKGAVNIVKSSRMNEK
jgi:flagellar protein FliS